MADRTPSAAQKREQALEAVRRAKEAGHEFRDQPMRAADAKAQGDGVEEWRGVYPGHCINPEDCRGFSHCPRRLSCVE